MCSPMPKSRFAHFEVPNSLSRHGKWMNVTAGMAYALCTAVQFITRAYVAAKYARIHARTNLLINLVNRQQIPTGAGQ